VQQIVVSQATSLGDEMNQFLRCVFVIAFVALSLVLVVTGVQAGGNLWWQTNGVPLTTAADGQTSPQAVSDDSGGAIIAWQDFRSGSFYDIYAQRVNATGQVQWTINGMPVSVASNDQKYPHVASDGQGGAFIVWQDKRNGTDYDIFAQRVLSNGVALWNTNGITICAAFGVQDAPQIVSDGQGGAIIVWDDNRSGSNYDVYAQRVSSTGIALWTPNGVNLNDPVTFPNSPPYPNVINDGDNGAIIAWEHSANSNVYIRAQRVLSDGNPLWTSGGITVSLRQGAYPTLVTDASGGAIVAWGSGAFYGQRIAPNGSLLWGANGITLETGYGNNVFLLEDGFHGAFAAWQRSDSGYNNSSIFVQHVLSDSVLGWSTDGVTITSMSGLQQVPRLVDDGHGGVVVVWQTASDTSGTNYSIWSQRLNQAGVSQWGVDGMQVISRTAYAMRSTVASDLAHGAIIAWEDGRSGEAKDIFAQHISDDLAISPTAEFSANPTRGPRPLTVLFADTSTGAISSWDWTFGDGSTSTLQNPTHQYTATGVFTVALQVAGAGGSAVITRSNYITVTEPLSIAAFDASPLTGYVPLVVNFTDQSTPGAISSWDWTFGDGSTSTFQNPTHQYTSTGVFTVALQVAGAGGSAVITRSNYITVTEPLPIAAFDASPLTGNVPLIVNFTDQSTGTVTNWSWQFGDGLTSTLPNPTHTYNLAGTYGVTLTVDGPSGTNSLFKGNLITVANQFKVYLPLILRNG
jgi:PKD repeat protein